MEALRVDLAGSIRYPQNIGLLSGQELRLVPRISEVQTTSDRVLARSN